MTPTVKDLSVRARNAIYIVLGAQTEEEWRDVDRLTRRGLRLRLHAAGYCRGRTLKTILRMTKNCGAVTVAEITTWIGGKIAAEAVKHTCVCRTCGKPMNGVADASIS